MPPYPTDPSVLIGSERHTVIDAVDRLEPFLVSLNSASDVWAFLTSNGSITAGRRRPEEAIFPYRVEDQLAEHAAGTGSVTRLEVTLADGSTHPWRPFDPCGPLAAGVRRSLAKNDLGDSVVVLEDHACLGVTATLRWQVSARYGLVRSLTIEATGTDPVRLAGIDGVVDLLPPGVTPRAHRDRSPLLTAYTLTELDPETGLAWVRLNSHLTDRAEASESLLVTTAWHCGSPAERLVISARGLDRYGADPLGERVQVRGERGAYLVKVGAEVRPGRPWVGRVVLDTGADITDLVSLRQGLAAGTLEGQLDADLQRTAADLRVIVAGADGRQLTGDPVADAHHLSSTLFNVMRGGYPHGGHAVGLEDLLRFLRERNRAVAERWTARLYELGPVLGRMEILAEAREWGDPDLTRLIREYLPLTFSRRHGDPSRPWNHFDIVLHDPQGAPRLDYQGNWRDIFQNWEALAWSYPQLTEAMIALFVNATTRDGYNPYRLSRAGVDWEVPDPDDPWSNIGYWSDHQIVYLGRLLELSLAQHPEVLPRLLLEPTFVHADIPYVLSDYEALVRDSRNTITFDDERHAQILARVARMGGDGRLVLDADGVPLRATLVEKLLTLVAAKLVNFVPDGGIWMNTQRPEWNDANNALVGSGVSVVTTAQLRRFLVLVEDLLGSLVDHTTDLIALPTPLADLYDRIATALGGTERPDLDTPLSPGTRRELLDALGRAGSDYRQALRTATAPSSRDHRDVDVESLCATLTLARAWVERAVRRNLRTDGLVTSYGILRLGDGTADVDPLGPMLEGQVALLDSGLLGPAEALHLLAALRASDLYRSDVRSYQLAPEPTVPMFPERNRLDPRAVEGSVLLTALLAAGDRRLVVADEVGDVHFAAALRNAADVTEVLAQLETDPEYSRPAATEGAYVQQVFEDVFAHSRFTGRSGSFFAYEGIGSVYWHMVSKLMLAARDNVNLARRLDAPAPVLEGLVAAYEEIRDGLGPRKTAAEFGAFPADCYSHTPAGGGARQPGMTGQVKEDMLARWSELGVGLREGRLDLGVPRAEDLLTEARPWPVLGLDGAEQTIVVPAGGLGFTLCQVPVVHLPGDEPGVVVRYRDGSVVHRAPGPLDRETTAAVLARLGAIADIRVYSAAHG